MRRAPLFTLLSLLVLVLGFYLWRDAAALGLKVPLDPNEGWNAYHAARAMAGTGLYDQAFFINNYPPLSFYAVGTLGKLTGDFIIAGRLISLFAFIAATCTVAAVARRLGASRTASVFAAQFFAAALLLASDYVAMDDPQMLGHALQLYAFTLLWRRRPHSIAAAFIFAASLFVKHNLLAMPLAACIFLWGEDRRAAWRFTLAGLGAGLLGLIAFRLASGQNLLLLLASPRAVSLANFEEALLRFLSWSGIAVGLAFAFLARAPRPKSARFALLYLTLSLGTGLAFAPGDGVDANIFFDAAMALGLTGAIALSRAAGWRAAALSFAYLAPLLLFAVLHFMDDDFAYTSRFRAQAAHDIAFLEARHGPVACEVASLCYWAGKPESLDVFNLGEAFKTGARGDAALVRRITARGYAVLQFSVDGPFALGPDVRRAIAAKYRLDHEDDNGVFFVPR